MLLLFLILLLLSETHVYKSGHVKGDHSSATNTDQNFETSRVVWNAHDRDWNRAHSNDVKSVFQDYDVNDDAHSYTFSKISPNKLSKIDQNFNSKSIQNQSKIWSKYWSNMIKLWVWLQWEHETWNFASHLAWEAKKISTLALHGKPIIDFVNPSRARARFLLRKKPYKFKQKWPNCASHARWEANFTKSMKLTWKFARNTSTR